jgi:dUTP pyrophosphatase
VSRTSTATELAVKRLRPDAVVPAQAYPGDAGFDLAACERVELAPGRAPSSAPGSRSLCPPGHAGSSCRAPGLAARHGLGKVNAPA